MQGTGRVPESRGRRKTRAGFNLPRRVENACSRAPVFYRNPYLPPTRSDRNRLRTRRFCRLLGRLCACERAGFLRRQLQLSHAVTLPCRQLSLIRIGTGPLFGTGMRVPPGWNYADAVCFGKQLPQSEAFMNRRERRHQRRMQRRQHKHNLRLLKKGAEGQVVSVSEQSQASSNEHHTSRRPRRFGCCLLILVLVFTLSASLPFWIFL